MAKKEPFLTRQENPQHALKPLQGNRLNQQFMYFSLLPCHYSTYTSMIRYTIAYLIVAAIIHDTIYAQSSSMLIMEKVNEKIKKNSTGFFVVDGLWKSATSDDTVRQKGEVYFFRNDCFNPDSICAFVLTQGGEIREAFDGQNYYHINHQHNQIATSEPFSERGVFQMIKGGYRHRWAFPPFLVANGKTPFTLTKFEDAKVDTLLINGTQYAIIQVVDSSENKHKLSNSDPDIMTIKEMYEVCLEDYSLRRLVQVANFWSSPQYEEFIFSPIIPLHDSLSFFRVFNLDSLLVNGYKYKVSKTRVSTLANRFVIGDKLKLPLFTNQLNDTFDLNRTPSKLLLLDFWYRGCPPCIQSMPIIEKVHRKYDHSDLAIYGINMHDREVEKFLMARDVTYPTLLDSNKSFTKAIGVTAYPTIILLEIDTGTILFSELGFIPDLESRISKIIDEAIK